MPLIIIIIITTPTLHRSLFTGRMLFLTPRVRFEPERTGTPFLFFF